jgi:hypothetical protein
VVFFDPYFEAVGKRGVLNMRISEARRIGVG